MGARNEPRDGLGSRAKRNGRRNTRYASSFVPFVANTWALAIESVIERYSSIIVTSPSSSSSSSSSSSRIDVRTTDYWRAEFFRLPRFRCIIQFAGGIFIRIVLWPRVERVGGEFIPGRKVVCRADHGVKSRKIGGPAGCPSQYAPYSESRQIGSTSKTILAENCSTNPYIKCPGYRARSREQGQPRP